MKVSRFALFSLALAASAVTAQQKDNFGDPLPEGAKARVGTTRMHRGGGSEWMGATLTPDGKFLLVAVQGGSIEKIDVSTGRRVATIGDKVPTREGREILKLSADGKRGMSIIGAEVAIWDAETGREIARLGGYGGSLSFDGKLIAFGDFAPPSNEKGLKSDPMGGPERVTVPLSKDKRPRGPLTATVWDVDKKEKLQEFAVEENETVGALISPDGKLLATSGTMHHRGGDRVSPTLAPDTPIQFWAVATGRKLGRVTLKKANPSAIVFSPDSKTVAVGTWGGTILLVDPQTGGVQPILADAGDVTHLVFSPDNKTLASGNFAGTVRFWDVAKAKEISSTKCPVRCLLTGFVFTDAGTVVAWGVEGSKAVAWEVPSGKILSPYGGHSDRPDSFAFTPDGKELLSGQSDPEEWIILRWDADTGKPLGKRLLPTTKDINLPPWRSVNLFPNGKKAHASAGEVSYVFDAKTGKKLHDLGLSGRGNSGRITQEGELLLTPIGVKSGELPEATKPLKLAVKELATGKKYPDIELPAPTIYQAMRSTDASRLLTRVYIPIPGGGHSEAATLWELGTGKKLGEVKGMSGPSWAKFEALPDNKSAIMTSQGGELRAIDLTTGKVTYEIDLDNLIPTAGPTISPNGKLFALGLCSKSASDPPFDVRIYDAATGKLLKTFRGHDGLVSAFAFSPDSKTLASGSLDTTVLLWDLTAIPAPK